MRTFSRWIDAERDEALLGTRAGEDGNAVAHVEDAVLSFGGGPRVCPGQVCGTSCGNFLSLWAPGS